MLNRRSIATIMLVVFGFFSIFIGTELVKSKSSKAVVEVTNCSELQDISLNLDATYDVTVSEIDCSGITDFASITNFNSEFNGNGVQITGYSSTSNGLFASITDEAVIRNVQIQGEVSNETGDKVGLLVGANNGGTISNGNSEAAITCNIDCGALVGFNGINGVVINSSSQGSVSANENVGGLVGNNAGAITNSQAAVVFSNDSRNVGGLVGFNDETGTIADNCDVNALVVGQSNVGGFIGKTMEKLKD